MDVLDQFSLRKKQTKKPNFCSRQGLYSNTPHGGAVVQKGYHKYASLQNVIITDYIINLNTISDTHLSQKNEQVSAH